MAAYHYVQDTPAAAQNTSPAHTAKHVLFGAAFALSASLVLLLALAALCATIDLPSAAFLPASALCAGFGALFGAMFAAKKIRRRALLVGIGVAGILFAALLLVSLLVTPGAFSFASLLRLLVMLPAGALGGFLGNRNKKPERASVRFR